MRIAIILVGIMIFEAINGQTGLAPFYSESTITGITLLMGLMAVADVVEFLNKFFSRR